MARELAGQATLTDADKAYHQIKEKIVTIQLKPGSVIREALLMGELNLGRTPIREALKRLQSENLVIAKPRRGMFVADVAITDLGKIYEVRVELESLGASLAAQRISSELLLKMKDLESEYLSVDKSDKKILLDLDCRFHALISQASNNTFLSKELELFHNLSLRIWHLAFNYFHPEDLDVKAHLAIIAAIESHDAIEAGQTMRRHIENFHKIIKQYL